MLCVLNRQALGGGLCVCVCLSLARHIPSTLSLATVVLHIMHGTIDAISLRQPFVWDTTHSLGVPLQLRMTLLLTCSRKAPLLRRLCRPPWQQASSHPLALVAACSGVGLKGDQAVVLPAQRVWLEPPTRCKCLVQEVAGQVRKHGPPHRALSRRESFKLTHVVHSRLAQTFSGQGNCPDGAGAEGHSPLDAVPEEVRQPACKHKLRLLSVEHVLPCVELQGKLGKLQTG